MCFSFLLVCSKSKSLSSKSLKSSFSYRSSTRCTLWPRAWLTTGRCSLWLIVLGFLLFSGLLLFILFSCCSPTINWPEYSRLMCPRAFNSRFRRLLLSDDRDACSRFESIESSSFWTRYSKSLRNLNGWREFTGTYGDIEFSLHTSSGFVHTLIGN